MPDDDDPCTAMIQEQAVSREGKSELLTKDTVFPQSNAAATIYFITRSYYSRAATNQGRRLLNSA